MYDLKKPCQEATAGRWKEKDWSRDGGDAEEYGIKERKGAAKRGRGLVRVEEAGKDGKISEKKRGCEMGEGKDRKGWDNDEKGQVTALAIPGFEWANGGIAELQ